MEDAVSELLNDIEYLELINTHAPASNAILDPNASRTYKLTITYKRAGKKSIAGLYDQDGLPHDWPDFAEAVHSFIKFYGLGELFDEKLYMSRRRRKDDLMFISVIFQEFGQEYCYLSKDETLIVGDRVKVPVGDHHRVITAEVVKVLWLSKEEAPIPFDRIKTAIGKAGD